jgi:hypothetical protein
MIQAFEIDLDQDADGIAGNLVLAASAVFHVRFAGKALPWEKAMRTVARRIEAHVRDQHLADPPPTHSSPDRPQ